MNYTEIFREALNQEDSLRPLREALVSLRIKGISKETLIAELELFRGQTATEDEEDLVLDVMDFLVGYCSPHMRIE